MKQVIIRLKNGKYVREEEWKYLVESPKEDATQFGEEEANKIIEHLGEGEKESIDEN